MLHKNKYKNINKKIKYKDLYLKIRLQLKKKTFENVVAYFSMLHRRRFRMVYMVLEAAL